MEVIEASAPVPASIQLASEKLGLKANSKEQTEEQHILISYRNNKSDFLQLSVPAQAAIKG